MDEFTSCEAVAEWAGELLEVPEHLRFTGPHLYKPGEVPDVVAILEFAEETDDVPADFPLARIQQANVAIFQIELSVMVEVPANEEEAKAGMDTLKGFSKAIREGIRADTTLGGRVEMTSKRYRGELDPARELADETVGPALIATVRVAETVSA